MNATFFETPDGRPLLDLRREAKASAPDLSELPALSDRERRIAIATWSGRMVNEHLSAQVWASLLPQLMRAAAPPAFLIEAADAAKDELRHAEACAGVVHALGGKPVAILPPIVDVPRHEEVGPLEAVLRNVISVGCLSETIAVSIIRAEQAELEGTPLGGVLRDILADEVRHARFGWGALGVLAPRLDADARARMDDYLVDALLHQIEHEIPLLPKLSVPGGNLALAGVCDGGAAQALFVDTIETVILPALESAGFAARKAWAAARSQTDLLNPSGEQHDLA